MISFLIPATATQKISDEPESIAKKYKIGAIAKIIINEPSAKNSLSHPDANCDGLFIDEKRIRFFLKNSVSDSQLSYRQGMLLDDCTGSASIFFKDGRQVKISIDHATGAGSILSKNGTAYYFNCMACGGILAEDFPFDPKSLNMWE